MPYGTPASEIEAVQYDVIFVDSAKGDDLMVNLTFQSSYTGPPTEIEKDDFMQRVVDALAAGDGLTFYSGTKHYRTIQNITATP